MEVAIIGGGASGIMCAVSLKREQKNIDVKVYERMPKILKKILVTGNGRCNLTNVNTDIGCYRGNTEFAKTALSKFPPESNISFFESIGLLTKTEAEGRVYPMSGQGSSVVNALRCEAERLGVKTVCDTEITEIQKKQNGFILNNKYFADCVVISAGGSAAKAQGTDGGSFRLLGSLGVNIISPKPALTALNAESFTKSLKGVRNICDVRLVIDGETTYREKGEVQFTDYGLSGIPIMQMSGLVSTSKSKNIIAELDCAPMLDKHRIENFLLSRKADNPRETAENVMCGLLPKALGNHLMLVSGIKKDSEIGKIDKNRLIGLAGVIKRWEVKIQGARGFDFAQVTAGGADCNDFYKDTLECKKVKNLYCTGEALDVYGLCGGYNLQWAWASGRLCAEAVLKEHKN